MNHLAKSLEGIIVNLKPCPFCGSDGVRSMRWDSHAGCSNSTCGAYNANLPISEWNTRATDPLIEELAEKIADRYCKDELLKEMVEALEEIVRCLSHGLQDCRASVTAKAMLQKYHDHKEE